MWSPADADLVRRDRDLPDLAFLLDADALAARLADTFATARVERVAITYLRYKPGQSCLASCRAQVDGQLVDFVAMAYRRDANGKFRKAATRPSVHGPLGQGRFVLDGSHVLVSVFPNDGKLDRLARLLSPEGLAALAARFRLSSETDVRLETLRYNPQRRFVARLAAGDRSAATVRCYTAPDYAGIVAKAGALRSRGPLKLARRLTRMHRFCLLGFEWLDGDLLEDMVVRRVVPPRRMELVGEALAHLHDQEAPALPRHGNASEASAAVALARHLAVLHPPLASLAQRVAERIAARLPHDGATRRPLHGDFYAKQVLLGDSTVALIDLDEASLGDPAIDLARFRADLEAGTLSGRLDSWTADALNEPLLAGYRRTREAPGHLHVHTAAQLFRLAAHAFRRRETSWPDVATAIVERAGTLADKEGGARRFEGPVPLAPERTTSNRPRPAPCPVVDPFGVTRDPLIACLAQALRAEPMAERFARRLCGLGRAAAVDVQRIAVMRYKPGLRCLIAYDLVVHGRGGSIERVAVMGKVRAQSADTSTHELIETLWTGCFGPDAGDDILVPEPLGVLPDVHMIVQRRVAGDPLGARLEGPAGLALARRAADAMHKLHGAAAATRRRHTVDDELRILRQRLTRVARERPDDRVRIERLLDACVALAERVRTGATCGIHRDCYPDQFLVDGDRLYLTDLDLYGEGPAALDVGNFVAHVEEYSLRRFGHAGHLADRNDLLIERYLQLSDRATREAIDIWATLSLVRHVAISTQFPERQPFTAAILDLCEQRVFDRAAVARSTSVSCGPGDGVRS